MTKFRRHLHILPVVLLLIGGATLSACGPDESPPPAPSSSTTPATSASPSSPETNSETAEQRNSRLAGEAVVKLWATLDMLSADTAKPLDELVKVARGQAAQQWQRNLTLMRGEGRRQIGAAAVGKTTATLDSGTNVYTVRACIDVSKVNVVDKDGKSVVAANRQPRSEYTYQVTQGQDGFHVTQDLLQATPC